MYTLQKHITARNRAFFEERPILFEVADKLQAFWQNQSQRICNLSMPPRLGKSYLANLLSEYVLLVSPNTKIFRVGYSAELSEQFSKDIKAGLANFMKANQKDIIDGTSGNWRLNYSDSTQPSMLATGWGGSITGFGANLLIFDDMHKNMASAISAADNAALQSFYTSVVLSRAEKNYKIINVGTRWTTNDWFSKFNPDVEIIIPALTASGDTICDAWKSTRELELIKAAQPPHEWSAQYLQRPTVTGHIQLFKDIDFRFAEPPEKVKSFITIDPSEEYGNDLFCCFHFAKYGGALYLLDIFAEPKYKLTDVAAWIKKTGCRNIFMEKNGGGNDKRKKMITDFGLPVMGFTTHSNKYDRAGYVRQDINDRLFVSPKCSHINDLLNNLHNFPTGTHDDLTDCLVMGFENEKKV